MDKRLLCVPRILVLQFPAVLSYLHQCMKYIKINTGSYKYDIFALSKYL